MEIRSQQLPAAVVAMALIWALLLVTPFPPARAQDAQNAGANWADLPEALQPRLASLQPEWSQWPAAKREKILRRAKQWVALSPQQQDEALQRLERWRALGPALQAALRQNLPHWETLGTDRRQRLQARMQSFERLPENERAALLTAFDGLSSAARRALLPPLPEDELSRLARELFAFVPIDEREATLRMLSSLSESAMLDLRALVEHRAPWQNEALRRELLEQPRQQREAWLGRQRAQR